MKALNLLSLLAPDDAASTSITSVVLPEGLDAEKIRATIKKKFDIVMTGGQDHLNGKIFRIGHWGFVGDRDILTAIAALEASIRGCDLNIIQLLGSNRKPILIELVPKLLPTS
jgi:aspartate aminotransferase-like enzyme